MKNQNYFIRFMQFLKKVFSVQAAVLKFIPIGILSLSLFLIAEPANAQLPGDCTGYCGTQSIDGCWCDESCESFGDCCDNVCDACTSLSHCVPPPPATCAGRCGTFDFSQPCQCDEACESFGDCCDDICVECTALSFCCDPVDIDACGLCPGDDFYGVSPEDDVCYHLVIGLQPHCCGDWDSGCQSLYNQCNPCGKGDNRVSMCRINKNNSVDLCIGLSGALDQLSNTDQTGNFVLGPCPIPTSCAGFCGTFSDDGCWCDNACLSFGDCCDDACEECGLCENAKLSANGSQLNYARILDNELVIYPNPFNDIATIEFSVAESGHVILEMFDMRGARVSTLIDGNVEADQRYQYTVNSTGLSNGVYSIRLTSSSGVKNHRLVLTGN